MTGTNGTVEIVFTSVNQEAMVTVNGNEIGRQGFLAHNDKPQSMDITPHLKKGSNQIFVKAFSGATYSNFIASLKNNDQVIHTWHSVNDAKAAQGDSFFEENVNFWYEGGIVSIPSGSEYWLKVDQVDDHLGIEINGTQYYEKTLTHHGGASTSYELTNHMVKGDNTIKLRLYNGLGHAVLKATLYADNTRYVANWSFSEAAGEKNAVVFEEEI